MLNSSISSPLERPIMRPLDKTDNSQSSPETVIFDGDTVTFNGDADVTFGVE